MLWEIAGTPHRLLASAHIIPEKIVMPDWVAASHVGIRRFVFEADSRSSDAAQIGNDPTGAHLKFPGAKETYHRAKTLIEPLGCKESFETLRPWRAAFHVLFYILPIAGLSHAFGIDHRLRITAENSGLAVEFLESPAHAFKLIDSSCRNFQDGLAFFERSVDETESGKVFSELKCIVQAWRNADLASLTAMHDEKLREFPFVFRPSVTERNKEWVTAAKRFISEAVPTLFIVGAIHTVGAGSFIEQLERDGIKLTRTSGKLE